MKRIAWSFGVLFVGTAIAVAQPPEGPRGGGRGGDFRPPPNPVVQALDTDGDGVISADEMKNAAESLAKLDANKDGKLTDDETRPKPPADGDRGPGGPGERGARDAGSGTRGAGDRGAGGPAGNRARGGDGRGAAGRGQNGAAGGRGQGGPGGPGGPGGFGGPGGGPGQGPGGQGGPGGPPGPERFMEHAMQFDADGDGKLNKDELAKFAADFAQRRGGGGPGAPGGPGGGGPDGRQGNGPSGAGSGERPRRPD